MAKATQIEAMAQEIAVVVRCTVECHFCGQLGIWESSDYCPDSTESQSAQDAANDLWKRGWRVVTSRKYQVVGAIRCGECKGET